MERTFAIIKPDAVAAGQVGEVISMIEKAGFKIIALKMRHLGEQEAQGFYAVHKTRPFFEGLIKFMTEGPVVVLALDRDDAVKHWRELMGATDPAKAAEGTIRKKLATSIERNVVHGSDASDTAAQEIMFFFPDLTM